MQSKHLTKHRPVDTKRGKIQVGIARCVPNAGAHAVMVHDDRGMRRWHSMMGTMAAVPRRSRHGRGARRYMQ